ncbi:MAG: arginase family protein [Bacteroidetes bacterium]|nr:arginase family protein [Bacteroidota bacterium]
MLKEEFFSPVSNPALDLVLSGVADSMAAATSVYSLNNGFPEIENAKIAIIGVPEYRGSVFNRQMHRGTEAIRDKFYRLKKHDNNSRIIDLGDLIPGNTIDDTFFALTEITNSLLKKSIIPIIIGGSQDLTIAQFNGYSFKEQLLNIAAVDSRFDLGIAEEEVNSSSWLGKIIMQQPNYLFNFSNIGYQTYFVGANAVDLMSKLFLMPIELARSDQI